MKKRFSFTINIKIRLAFQFMLVVGCILLLFALLVYYFTIITHREKFRNNLLNRAKYTAIILNNKRVVDTLLLKNIFQATFATQNQEIIISDSSFSIIYIYNNTYLSKDQIRIQMSANDHSFFSIGEKDGVFYRFEFNKKPAFIFLLAFDKARNDYLKDLRQILYWSILFSLWLSVLFSYLFSRKAFSPVLDIIKNVKAISSSSLHKRLDEGDKKDELERLAITFNEMLSDLEKSFRNQEDFVANASHELRTPISILIAESDYFISKEHTIDECKAHIANQIDDIKRLNTELNNLLLLAQVNKDNHLQLTPIRLDEVIFDSIREIKGKYKNRKILTKITYSANEPDLIISGHSGLLNIAFRNILDNACKFSRHDVFVEVIPMENTVRIIITDTGIGIPTTDLENIFKPFNRAANTRFKSGFGIGLSLVSRIIEYHNAKITVESVENSGSKFELEFIRANGIK